MAEDEAGIGQYWSRSHFHLDLSDAGRDDQEHRSSGPRGCVAPLLNC
jgi:hypothetical protein